MDPAVLSAVMLMLHQVYNEVESARSVIVRDSVRMFLSELVIDSLIFRRAEWDRLGFNLTVSANAPNVANRVRDSVKSVLMDAPVEATIPGMVGQVGPIALLQEIQRLWCTVFPLCR
jgi:hypothetical protein